MNLLVLSRFICLKQNDTVRGKTNVQTSKKKKKLDKTKEIAYTAQKQLSSSP